MTASGFVAAAVALGCFGAASAQDAAAPVDMTIATAEAPVEDAAAPLDMTSTITDPAELAALVPPYSAFPGTDYGPLITPPPLVPIVDIGGGEGIITIDAVECAEMCTLTVGCNSASYYGDNPAADWPAGYNCFLKTLTGCELPADALAVADATIFMIGGPDCGAGAPLAATPLAAGGPIAAAPIDALPLTPPASPLAAPPPDALPDALAPTTVDDTAADAPVTTATQTGLEPPDQAGDPLAAVSPPSDGSGDLRGAATAAFAVAGAALFL